MGKLKLTDVAALKARVRRIWDMGDYSYLSKRLEPASRELCDACAVSAGQEVLDVAAGDGNFALACAREGASVVASDFAPGMVARGRERSEEEGCSIEWVEADAEELPFEEGRFDCAGSVFGVMIAPRPERVAHELFRVVRPGNTVGLTAWVPNGIFAELFAIGRRFSPAPAGAPHAEDWGDEAVVRERLGGLAAHVECEPRTLTWEADSPETVAAELAEFAPTFAAAREGLPAEQFDQLRAETLDLVRRRNRASDGTLRIDAEYLISVARKRG